MDFKELTDIWNSNNQQMNNDLQVNERMFRELSQQKVKRSLGEIRFELIFEIISTPIFLMYLTPFLVDQIGQPKFFIPGLFLALVTLFGAIFAAYRLLMTEQINVHASVVRTQKLIERLRYYEKLEVNSLLVIIPIFSAAFLLVAVKGLAGIDLYLVLGEYLWWYTGGSFLVGLIIVVLLRLFPNKKLIEAQAFLNEIKDLEG